MNNHRLLLAPVSFLCLSALASVCPGCSDPDGAERGGGDSKSDNPAAPGTEFPQLAPAYALELDSLVTVKDARTGDISELRTTANMVATVEQIGADLSVALELCSIAPPELRGNQPVIDDALIESLPMFSATGRITNHGSGPELFVGELSIALGANLAGAGDSLPQDGGDPRVFDQDRDGRPGITIGVSLFSVFGAAKLDAEFTAGLAAGVSFIEGEASVSLSTAIYGDTIPFVDAAREAREAEQNSEPIDEVHKVSLAGLAAGSTCANPLTAPLPEPADGCSPGSGDAGDCCDAGTGADSGVCIDTRASSCPSGELLSGECPSGSSAVLCCVR